ncbi:MAG: DUF736 domain-containing protein [Pseudomonadota bacterium]|jgi:uncharacterized protein (DUF736 family)|uniref:DUF736 domain-containing protein n=1 Tax=unclassified Sphingomonas TaxID=196159 RepID=UPI00053E5750|nr:MULTISPECIES: DUF736 domain-containing protein [unclassified Sphingomonas]
MSKIGSFKKISGELRGEIFTLALHAKAVRIVPLDNVTGNAPSHRVLLGESEVGAAWTKRTNDDRPYLSVKLDDPSFVAPIFAQLFEKPEGTFDLVWTRPQRRSKT